MTITDVAVTDEKKVKNIALTIDGVKVNVPQGTTVLEAARKAGIYIPTLCYYPDLTPNGGCRMCIVEIENMRGLPASCSIEATDGMVVHTDTPAVKRSRMITMELIMANHPSECLICHRRKHCGPNDICLRNVAVSDRCVSCSKNQQCELQDIVAYLGMDETHFGRLRQRTRVVPIDDSNPFFNIDHNRCILCTRCTRACHEITCVDAIEMAYRGDNMKVSTAGDGPLVESICRSCGECMVRCPVGAMTPKDIIKPEQEIKTICPYCGVGCQLYLCVNDGRVTGVRGDPEGPVNRGKLCVKGRFGIAEFVNHADRLKTPLVRRNGRLEEATWDEALEIVARRLGRYRGDEVAVISSAKTTNEDNYVMQKFARAVLDTNNVDHCARL
jgi:predicted molibdopterin-dependent oxidoreductase YjgC